MVPFSKKIAQFRRSFISRQKWSLPDSIIYYILKKPSTSKLYQKLIQSCKYFFIKNPILIVSEVYFDYKNGWQTTFSERYVNLYKTASKIWITKEIFNLKKNNAFSFLIPKIFKCDIKKLCLSEQNISFDELKFIASKCERIWFNKVSVMKNNVSIIPLEKIIDVLPNLEIFEYGLPDTEIITSKAMQELIKILHFKNIARFQIFDIPENFDISTFFDYLKKNMKTKILLNFSRLISTQYKNRLEIIVNEILETTSHDYKVPYIFFSGMNESSNRKLWNLFSSS